MAAASTVGALMDDTTATQVGARRPIRARQSGWAKAWAARLAKRGVSPNAISAGSVVCGVMAGACLVGTRFVQSPWGEVGLFAGAIVGIQGRLICNLLDGMVAVEGGKGSKSGEVYNDFPDRLADPIILVAAGYAAPMWHGVELGWAAALLAVMTAYVRVLGRSIGSAVYFAGPMAKQHRMAVMTGACAVAAVAAFWQWQGWAVWGAIVLIIVGCVVTVIRRFGLIVRELEGRA